MQGRPALSRGEPSRVERSGAERSGVELSRAEQSRAEQSRAERSRAEQGRAEQSRAAQSKAEQNRANQGRAEQSRAQQGTVAQTTFILIGRCLRAYTHEHMNKQEQHSPKARAGHATCVARAKLSRQGTRGKEERKHEAGRVADRPRT